MLEASRYYYFKFFYIRLFLIFCNPDIYIILSEIVSQVPEAWFSF